MLRDSRLTRLGQRVENELGVHALSDPLAAAAAVASMYAQNKCTPADAVFYLDMLATATGRLDDAVDPDALRCRLGVVCGSSLLKFGEELLWSFLDPSRAALRARARVSHVAADTSAIAR